MDYRGYNPNNQEPSQWNNQPNASYPSPQAYEQQNQYSGQQQEYHRQEYQQQNQYIGQQPYPTPGYTPQIPYAAIPVMITNQADSDRSKAVAGLVLGIVGLAIWLIPLAGAFISIICSILGLVFSIQGRRSITGRSMATAGMVLSIIALVLVPILLFCSAGLVLLI